MGACKFLFTNDLEFATFSRCATAWDKPIGQTRKHWTAKPTCTIKWKENWPEGEKSHSTFELVTHNSDKFWPALQWSSLIPGWFLWEKERLDHACLVTADISTHSHIRGFSGIWFVSGCCSHTSVKPGRWWLDWAVTNRFRVHKRSWVLICWARYCVCVIVSTTWRMLGLSPPEFQLVVLKLLWSGIPHISLIICGLQRKGESALHMNKCLWNL